MSATPLYVSRSTVRSLWQVYRIYNNRVEFETHFGRMTVPLEDIETVDVSPSDLKELLLRGDLMLDNFRPALKLDWANFLEHLVLDKSRGRIRRVLFTPDDPAEFKRVLDDAIARHANKRELAGSE